MADPSVSLCDEANVDGYVHIADEVLRILIVCMDEGKRDHYMFLHAALAKCELSGGITAPISVAARRVIRTGSPWSGLVLGTPVRRSCRLLTPSGGAPSARGWSWTCTHTSPVGLTGDVSAS